MHRRWPGHRRHLRAGLITAAGATHGALRRAPAATLAHKLLARAARRDAVRPGERLRCRPDHLLADAAAEREAVLSGQVRPGDFCVTRSGPAGQLGALGVWSLDADQVGEPDSVGEYSLTAPTSLLMRWSGCLSEGVAVQDMLLTMRQRLGPGHSGPLAVEFGGEAVLSLGLEERLWLCAQRSALGAEVGLVAPDARSLACLALQTCRPPVPGWASDEDAPGERQHFDASMLAPQVAMPVQACDICSVDALTPTPLHWAVLGGEAGASLADLHAAARVLAGFRIASGVQLLVVPAGLREAAEAERRGYLRLLQDAGAMLRPPGSQVLPALLREPVKLLLSTPVARPLPHQLAQVYAASAYTVAASALAGQLADARQLLA